MDGHMIFRVLLIIIAAFVLIALINYYNVKQVDSSVKKERFFNPSNVSQPHWDNSSHQIVGGPVPNDYTQPPVVMPSEEKDDERYRTVDFVTQKLPSDCFPRDRLTSEDLLPHDASNSKFAQINPAGQGSVSDQNFLTAGYHVGINTVGSSMRNANLQLRSDPVIQKGSWPIMNSSIDPDLLRKPFEIGATDY
jgi:hypothetical protein